MLPIELRLQGLYSYQELQVIDFQKLTKAGLFGIFGPVGSGKSAILEAMTFALYGKTERLNKQTDKAAYNMLNMQAKDLHIEFMFQQAGKRYLFVASAKRNSKHFKEVGGFKHKAYVLKNKDRQIISAEKEGIACCAERVLGLNYPNFIRTIIIPQNQFQAFLSLKPKARADMFNELFGLDKYDLQDKTRFLLDQNKVKLAGLQAQQLALGDCSLEAIAKQTQSLCQDEKALEQLALVLKNQTLILQEQEQLKKLVDLLAVLEPQLQAKIAEKPHIEAKERQLALYEYCFFTYQVLFETLGKLAQSKAKTKELLAQKEQENQVLSEKIALQEQDLALLNLQVKQIPNLEKKSQALLHLAKIKDLEIDLADKKFRINKGLRHLASKEKALEIVKLAIKTQKKEVLTIKKGLPDPQELALVVAWQVQDKQLIAQLDLHQQQLLYKKKQLENLQNKHHTAAKAILKLVPSFVFSIENLLSETDKAIQKVLLQLDEMAEKARWQHHLTQLEMLAGQLETGKPCPLCGAMAHPKPFELLEKTELKNQKEQLEKQQKTLLALQNNLRINEQSSQIIRQDISELHIQIEKTEQAKTAHALGFVWKKYLPFDASVLHKKQKKYREDSLLLDGLTEKICALEVKEEALIGDLEQYKKRLQVLQNELGGLQSEIKTFASLIHETDISAYKAQHSEQLLLAATQIQQQITHFTENKKTALETLSQLKEASSKNGGRLEALQSELTQTEIALKLAQDQTAALLSKEAHLNADSVRQILAQNKNRVAEKAIIDAFNADFLQLQSQVNTLKNQSKGLVYNACEHANLLEQNKLQAAEQAILQGKIGKQKADILRLEADFKVNKALQTHITSLESLIQNLQKLFSLFQGKAFVLYIASAYLQHLSALANERFRVLTKQQLSLEIEGEEFVLRDHLNQGAIRHIRTLSGGQTFQAALCLALALADSVQANNLPGENFFFLDEGFGSLDKEALLIVFDTLKSLHKENRIIGVISHVEEIKQEVNAYLLVHSDLVTGSKVLTS